MIQPHCAVSGYKVSVFHIEQHGTWENQRPKAMLHNITLSLYKQLMGFIYITKTLVVLVFSIKLFVALFFAYALVTMIRMVYEKERPEKRGKSEEAKPVKREEKK